jgi:hypothetical protein
MQRRSSPEASRPSQISRLLRSSEAVNAAGQPGVARVGGSGSSSTSAPRTPMSRTEAANAGGGGQRGVVAVDSARARQRPSSGGGRRFGCRPGWTANQIPSAPGSLKSVGSHSCGPDRSQGYHTLSFRLPLVLTRAVTEEGRALVHESPRRGWWSARGTSTAACLCTARRTLRSISPVTRLTAGAWPPPPS